MLTNRVIDPDQFASHFRLLAVYDDETSYPGMIYPWLGTFRLLNGLAHPDALRHAGFGGGVRRSAIKPRTCASSARDTATSASWRVMDRPCRTTLAPILTSFTQSVTNFRWGSKAAVLDSAGAGP